MKFIELTDRAGDKLTINTKYIEKFYKVEVDGKTFTKLVFAYTTSYYIYVKESYEQIKEALGV